MQHICKTVLPLLLMLAGCQSPRARHDLPCNRETVAHIVSAGCFLKELSQAGGLSGISTNDHLNMGVAYPDPCDAPSTPVTLILRATLDKTPDTIYWFSVSQVAGSANWLLEKLWTTDLKGNILAAQLPLPSLEKQNAANQNAVNSREFKDAMQRLFEHPVAPYPRPARTQAEVR